MTRPPATRRLAQRQRSEQLILEAARDLFGRHGYAAVTLRSVGEAAGRSTGAMAKRFRSKEDLWRAAMGCEPPTAIQPGETEALEAALRNLIWSFRQGGLDDIALSIADAETVLARAEAERTPPVP